MILNVYASIPTNSMTPSAIVVQKETVEDVTKDLIQHGLALVGPDLMSIQLFLKAQDKEKKEEGK